jgi:uncharacterized cupin superfamily protein
MSFDLYGEEWDETQDATGFRWRRAHVGRQLGAAQIGASVYELEPGERTWPHHFHHGNEEWLIVLAGRPTLRGRDGEQELEPGDTTCFPAGPDGAHQVINRSQERCRVLVISTLALPDVVEYPDSGKVGVRTITGRYNVAREPELGYWEGER